MCSLTLFLFFCWNFIDTRFGAGGRIHGARSRESEFLRKRRDIFNRMRNNSHVIDPEVRAREIIRIERQLAEIESETVEEIGEEVLVERGEYRPAPAAVTHSP
jgi:hypothetical protein